MLEVVSSLTVNLITLGVGALFTALLGGVLAPWVKGLIDRRRERLESSVELVDTLAQDLWNYWKLALRVAYYGAKGSGHEQYHAALAAWDSDDSWARGCSIQVQVSRARRLLPPEAHQRLVSAQEKVVSELDKKVDEYRDSPTTDKWNELQAELMNEIRPEIDVLLSDVVQDLNLDQTSRAP